MDQDTCLEFEIPISFDMLENWNDKQMSVHDVMNIEILDREIWV